jgi:tryptophan synthase alpha chain
VAELRTHTDTPVCVGFGISNADTVKTVCDAADGAIVGSAIIHRITDAIDLPTDEMAAKVGGFVSELLAPII